MFSKMFSVAAKVRDFIETRAHAPRRRISLPVTISLAGPRRTNSGSLPPIAALGHKMEGQTLDLSENGLGLILPAIRLGDFYLTNTEAKIYAALCLDNETLDIEVTPVRYERLEDESGYLVGMKIKTMKPAARAAFDTLLQQLSTRKSRPQMLTLTHKVGSPTTASARA